MSAMKINLGSGAKPTQGFANIDRNRKSPNVNLVCDLDLYPWPFKDESACQTLTSKVL